MYQTSSTAPSDKQIAFLSRLSAERGIPMASVTSRKAASALIDALLRTPAAPKQAAAEPLTPGIYRNEAGEIFKVQASRDNSGKVYAKKLQPIGGRRLTELDEIVKWEFVYAMGAIRTLTAANRLTLEEAKQFGIKYGVCIVCGRLLSDATSVANGIGPVCATRV
jgi:hypothetical protein